MCLVQCKQPRPSCRSLLPITFRAKIATEAVSVRIDFVLSFQWADQDHHQGTQELPEGPCPWALPVREGLTGDALEVASLPGGRGPNSGADQLIVLSPASVSLFMQPLTFRHFARLRAIPRGYSRKPRDPRGTPAPASHVARRRAEPRSGASRLFLEGAEDCAHRCCPS